eukprot:5067842-Pleurochrysis_carterae.AAC.1
MVQAGKRASLMLLLHRATHAIAMQLPYRTAVEMTYHASIVTYCKQAPAREQKHVTVRAYTSKALKVMQQTRHDLFVSTERQTATSLSQMFSRKRCKAKCELLEDFCVLSKPCSCATQSQKADQSK